MSDSPINKRIGFIGAGQMAKAMAAGFIGKGLVSAESVCFFDPNQNAREDFASATGGRALSSNQDVIAQSEIIFLAIKPQFYPDIVAEIGSGFPADKILVSIVAGMNLGTLSVDFQSRKTIRVMPNTPGLIGQGASGICCNDGVTDDENTLIVSLLEANGIVCQVTDPQIDMVTGVSGSGPAFVFTFIEALIDGGVNVGLPRATARQLAIETVIGSAELVKQSGDHPGVLRDQVTSPGGTTIAGMQALEESGFRAAVMLAVEAATLRARELGEND